MKILIIGENCTAKLATLFASLLKSAYPTEPIVAYNYSQALRVSPSKSQLFVFVGKPADVDPAFREQMDLVIEVPNDSLATVAGVCNFADLTSSLIQKK